MLSDGAVQLHQFIRDFISNNGYSPSYREMAAAVEVNSTRTISRYLLQLREAGLVDWTPQRRRTLRLTE